MSRTPEGAVLKAVTDLLTAENIWWMRCQTGAHVLENNGRKRMFRAGRPGMADLLALPDQYAAGRDHFGALCDERHIVPTWIEVKAPNGRQSEAQRLFEREVTAEGHRYLLVRDVSELQREVGQWRGK